jgi:hypothetical protein
MLQDEFFSTRGGSILRQSVQFLALRILRQKQMPNDYKVTDEQSQEKFHKRQGLRESNGSIKLSASSRKGSWVGSSVGE